ncbi:MAG: glycosyltransferase [Proteobacteria bacterium]|nr:MAG: glycosyltransferase [Pseudomonadota bacterium]
MIKNPLISVYILCYNHEKYVAQAIESVLNQTYEHIELLIVDNASTDNSTEIIKSYEAKDKRIKFFQMKENTFPSYGSNYAIKLANGEYVTPLAADDYFELDKIERQLKFIQHNNIDICFTWVKTVDDLGNESLGHWADQIFNRNFDNQIDLMDVFIKQGNTICAITWMIKKDILESFGYFDNRLLQTQDFDLWLKIIKKYPITVLKEKLTCYRVRDDGENLSININKSGQVRCITEAVWFMQHICDLNANVISQVIDKPCDEKNKYKVLFNYYLDNHNKAYATAVLFALYNKLGADFTFPSPLYQDFLEMYSNFDMFDHFGLNGAVSQLFITTLERHEFNGEHYFSQVIGLNQRYIYSLSKYTNITRLRLDPINQPAKVKLLSAQVKLTNGENYSLELVWHNADLNADVYDFKHDDPQFVFDIPIAIQADLVSVEFVVDITPYNKWEILGLLSQVRSELHHAGLNNLNYQQQLTALQNQLHTVQGELNYVQNELTASNENLNNTQNELNHIQDELTAVYQSQSWKITKPLRKFCKLFKG